MKKTKKIFTFLIILFVLFSFAFSTRASDVEEVININNDSGLTMINGASIRTTGTKQGIKFTAMITDKALEKSIEHGFYLVIGDHSKAEFVERIKAGKTVWANNNILQKPISRLDEEGNLKDISDVKNTFSCVIYGFNDTAYYIKKITALAYVKYAYIDEDSDNEKDDSEDYVTEYDPADASIAYEYKYSEVDNDNTSNTAEIVSKSIAEVSVLAFAEYKSKDVNCDVPDIIEDVYNNIPSIFHLNGVDENGVEQDLGVAITKTFEIEAYGTYEVVAGKYISYHEKENISNFINYTWNRILVKNIGDNKWQAVTATLAGELYSDDKYEDLYDGVIGAHTATSIQATQSEETIAYAETIVDLVRIIKNGGTVYFEFEAPTTKSNTLDLTVTATIDAVMEYNYEYGKELATPEEAYGLTVEGYDFVGWYDPLAAMYNRNNYDSETGEYTEGYTPLKTITMNQFLTKGLKAVWKLSEYPITYNLNGGTNPEEAATYYTIKDTLTLPTPTKSGYMFAGWYTDYDSTNGTYSNRLESIEEGSTGAVTLYAKWIEEGEYTVGDTSIAGINYATIQEALTAAPAGSTIVVYDSYDGSKESIITIDKSITIYDATYQGIKAVEGRTGGAIIKAAITISGSNVTLDGLTLSDNAAINLDGASNVTLTNIYSTSKGVNKYTYNSVLYYSVIYSTTTATNIMVNDSYISAAQNCFIPLYFVSVDGLEIENNDINNGDGTYTNGSVAVKADTLAGIIKINENNIYISTGNRSIDLGATKNSATETWIRDNTISGAKTAAIRLGNADDGTAHIIHNIIEKSNTGNNFDFSGSTGVIVKYNKFIDCTYKLTNAGTNTVFKNNYYSADPSSNLSTTLGGSESYYTDDYTNNSIKSDSEALHVAYYSDKDYNPDTAYTITYDAGDGTVNPTIQNACINYEFTLATPTLDGYRFLGWTTEAISTNYITILNLTSLPTDSNITLYAHWEVQKYSIMYELNGGTTEASYDTEYAGDETVELPDSSTMYKDHAAFLGWSTTEDGTSYITSVNAATDKDVTIYAIWDDYNLIEVTDEQINNLNNAEFDLIVNLQANNTASQNQQFVKYNVIDEETILEEYSSPIYTYGTDMFKTITDALTAAKEGDIIYVMAGEFSETITVSTNNITIKGENADINPNTDTRNAATIINGAVSATSVSGLTINGLDFTGSTTITTNNVTNFVFRNNNSYSITYSSGVTWVATSAYTYGFILMKGDSGLNTNVTYQDNLFSGISEVNINLTYINGATFEGNVFKDFGTDAIRFNGTNSYGSAYGNINIQNNEFIQETAGGYNGIFFRYYGDSQKADSVNISIDNNEFTNIGNNTNSAAASTTTYGYSAGILLRSYSEYTEANKANISITNNTFEDCYNCMILRNNGAESALNDWAATVEYNIFKDIPTGYYHINRVTGQSKYDTSDTSTTNPELTVFGVNTYYDNDGNLVESMDTVSSKILHVASIGTCVFDSYTITYNGYNGYGLDPVVNSKAPCGEDFTLPTPTLDGYYFLGWTTEKDSTDYIKTYNCETKGSIINLYAHWEELVTYNVTFDLNGGQASLDESETIGTIVANSYNGSYTNDTAASNIFIFPKGATNVYKTQTRIYIKSTDIENVYEVVGTQNVSETVSYPTGTEYVISIWTGYTGSDMNVDVTKLSEGTVVYASGALTSASTTPVTFTFGATNVVSGVVEMEINKYSTILVPTLSGATFTGWYDTNGNRYTKATDFTQDITVTARYETTNPLVGEFVNQSWVMSGDTINLKALDSYGADVTESISWTSDNNDIATVDAGVVTGGNTPGTVKITAVSSITEEFNFDFYVTVLDETNVDIEEFLAKSNNSKVYTTENLIIGIEGASPTEYYTDIVGSVSKILFEGYSVNKNETYYLDSSEIIIGQVGVSTTGEKSYGLFSDTSLNKTGKVEFITFHYAADMNGSATGGGLSLAKQASNLSSTSSWHYGVGNDGVWICMDNAYTAFHAGSKLLDTTWLATGVYVEDGDPAAEFTETTIGDDNNFYINGRKATLVNESGVTITATNMANHWNSSGLPGTITTLDSGLKLNLYGLGVEIIDNQYYICEPYYNTGYGWICAQGGNVNSIGIESSVAEGSDLWLTWQYSAQLCAKLLLEHNLPITRLTGHHFWTGKWCPEPMLENNKEIWWEFLEMVRQEMTHFKTYNSYNFEFSTDSIYLDNNGRVTSLPDYTECVTYTVEYEEGKTITLSTILPGSIY